MSRLYLHIQEKFLANCLCIGFVPGGILVSGEDSGCISGPRGVLYFVVGGGDCKSRGHLILHEVRHPAGCCKLLDVNVPNSVVLGRSTLD